MNDESKTDEALEILAARVKLTPDEYEPFLEGTYILPVDEALEVWKKADGLGSIYGSSKISDEFNVKYKVYDKPEPYESYFDPSLTSEYAATR